jgi:hypothetical protein
MLGQDSLFFACGQEKVFGQHGEYGSRMADTAATLLIFLLFLTSVFA